MTPQLARLPTFMLICLVLVFYVRLDSFSIFHFPFARNDISRYSWIVFGSFASKVEFLAPKARNMKARGKRAASGARRPW